MDKVILTKSHEDYFLDQGHLLALGFREGWFCVRILQRQWSGLRPWSLGAVAAGANLANYDEIQDANQRHYLEPFIDGLIYHSFWGVTPTPARIFVQFPPRTDMGSMLQIPRSIAAPANVGYIDGYQSPFDGPFSLKTEIFTVKERYSAYQAYNPVGDAMTNVMLNFDQMQYSYEVITDLDLIKSMLIGERRVRKYTMGTADPLPMRMPQWLLDIVNNKSSQLLQFTLDVVRGKA